MVAIIAGRSTELYINISLDTRYRARLFTISDNKLTKALPIL